jgi:transcriptional regulator with XRE-family HTH domain
VPRRPHDRSTSRRSSRLLWKHDYEQFRRRLVEARERSGLTQREAAAELGRPNSYVAKCENGERRVDAVELAKFAALYHRPIRYFFPFLRDRR